MRSSRGWLVAAGLVIAVELGFEWLHEAVSRSENPEALALDAHNNTGMSDRARPVADSGDLVPSSDSLSVEMAAESRLDEASEGRVAGRVLSFQEMPSHEARLTVRSHAKVEQEVLTDAEGRFELEGLPLSPTELTVEARAIGHASLERAFVLPGHKAEVASLTLRLPRTQTVEGIVVDDDGRPVPDTRVWAWVRLFNQELRGARLSELETSTDVDGRFHLASVPTIGSVTILAWKPGYTVGEHHDLLVAKEALQLRLVPRGETELEVRVTDHHGAISGLPIRVTLLDGCFEVLGIERTERTDLEGRARFEALPSGVRLRCLLEAGQRSFRLSLPSKDGSINRFEGALAAGRTNRIPRDARAPPTRRSISISSRWSTRSNSSG